MNTLTDSDDDIVTHWEMSGLLEDVPDEDRQNLAHALHACLLHLRGDNVDQQICGMLLPAIRRVYNMNKEIVTHFLSLQKLIEEKLATTKDEDFVSGMDYEITVLADACEEYVKNTR